MWWESTTSPERDERLRGFLLRFGQQFEKRDGSGEGPTAVVHGFGSVSLDQEYRAPLLVVDAALDERYERLSVRASDQGATAAIVRRLWRMYGPSLFPRSAFTRTDRFSRPELFSLLRQLLLPREEQCALVARRSTLPIADIGDYARYRLEDLDIPPNTRVMFSPQPRPTALARDFVTPRGDAACLGISLVDGKFADLVTTVAHAFDEVPCLLRRERRGFLRRIEHEVLGTAEWSSEHGSDPGRSDIDVAVVRRPPLLAAKLMPCTLAKPEEGEQRTCRMFGRDEPRTGYTYGALQLMSSGTRRWTHCFLVWGDFSGINQAGDSGAAVVMEGGAVLGHVVAGGGFVNDQGRYQHAAVQDARTLRDYLKKNYSATVFVADDGGFS